MKVKNLMTHNVLTVTGDMSIRKLVMLLEQNRITGAPVVDGDGKLIGIVSGRDIVKAIDRLIRIHISIDEQQEDKGKYNWVEGIMTADVFTCGEDDDVQQVFNTMVEKKIHRLPVVKDGKPVGIISSQDACKLVSGLKELKI
ncbi:MAG: CBS domain-containing protein [Candidatus Glassbacteria bacterium]|nr:CBS domain-containing protein [Candidatus Glassbacteria bacterium]